MLSAWNVYLVMQLDTISTACFCLSVIFGLVYGLKAIVTFVASLDEDADALEVIRKFWFVGPIFALTLTGAVFLPSSKTAAAMILVPALTSDQVVEPVTAEAKELYVLAKKALAKLGNDAPEAKKEK